MKKEILGRRNNQYKREYDEYLQIKKGLPYSYQRFYELRQDYSFEEVLKMKNRKEGGYGNGRKGFEKYTEQYIKLIYGAIKAGNTKKEVAEMFNITYYKVRYIYNLYIKKDLRD